MSNVNWLLILYALVFGGTVLALMFGLVYLEVWLLQQVTELIGRWLRRRDERSQGKQSNDSAGVSSVCRVATPLLAPKAVPRPEPPSERCNEPPYCCGSDEDQLEFEPGWSAEFDDVAGSGSALDIAPEPLEQHSEETATFQPILASANLDVDFERLPYHAGMLRSLRDRASPLLRASLANNIGCCFANVGDLRSAAEIFRQARKVLVADGSLFEATLAEAGLANMRELVALGVPGIAEQLSGLEDFLKNPAFALFRQPIIDIVNSNLDMALLRLSGR
jgi:hypothetical protein